MSGTRPGVVLTVLTGLNGLNYLDRYIAAATLPLILAGLAISDTAGGLLQSAFILTYSLACPIAGWLGDEKRDADGAGVEAAIRTDLRLTSRQKEALIEVYRSFLRDDG